MLNYAQIKDNKILGMSNAPYLNEDILNIEVDDSLYNDYQECPYKYIWDGLQVVVNPNYEQEQELKERERIARLNLTGADVERGIYKVKGMDFNDILAYVAQLQPEGLDIKALGIELKANNFYRGNPYVDAVGALLGFTSEQLDKFFETNDYTNLLA